MSALDGIFLIDKPEGITSASALNRIKRVLPKGVKIGHGGTLDPFATGLLVAFLGSATRLSTFFLSGDKEYEGVARFGVRTESGDPTTAVIERSDKIPQNLEAMRSAAQKFVGVYHQTPPMHSAIKVNGRPLYESARRGEEVERASKERRIDAFDLIEFQSPEARFRVACSGGTYIRVLAEDWAKNLGSIAMLASLRRTRSSRFSVKEALSLDDAIRSIEGADYSRGFIAIDRVFDSQEGLVLEDSIAARLQNGEKKTVAEIGERAAQVQSHSQPTPIFNSKENLIAVFKKSELAAVFRQGE